MALAPLSSQARVVRSLGARVATPERLSAAVSAALLARPALSALASALEDVEPLRAREARPLLPPQLDEEA